MDTPGVGAADTGVDAADTTGMGVDMPDTDDEAPVAGVKVLGVRTVASTFPFASFPFPCSAFSSSFFLSHAFLLRNLSRTTSPYALPRATDVGGATPRLLRSTCAVVSIDIPVL